MGIAAASRAGIKRIAKSRKKSRSSSARPSMDITIYCRAGSAVYLAGLAGAGIFCATKGL